MTITFIKSPEDQREDQPVDPAPLPPPMAELVRINGNRDPVFDRLAHMAADCVQELTRIQLEAQVALLNLNQTRTALLRIERGDRDSSATAAVALENIGTVITTLSGWLNPPASEGAPR